MKQKIYVKLFDGAEPLEIKEKGDWIDLRTRVDVDTNHPIAKTLTRSKVEGVKNSRNVEFEYHMIPLGVAMKLPKGMEAHILPRSSTFAKWGLMLVNSQGIIDNSYSGNNDEWKYPAISFVDKHIPANTAIAQFRLMPSRKATFWQKLKWFMSTDVEIVYVDKLDDVDRGGFGSTGDK